MTETTKEPRTERHVHTASRDRGCTGCEHLWYAEHPILPPEEPRTEAGRSLLDALIGLGADNDEGEGLHDIRAIEAEAARLALEGVAERVRGLPEVVWAAVDADDRNVQLVSRAAVLAAVEGGPR